MRKPFLTPPSMPEALECRTLSVPSSKEWLGIFNSALLEMTKAYNYEQVNDTDLTPEEVATYCFDQYVSWLSSTCGGGGDCPLPGTEAPPFRIGQGGHLEQAVGGEWVTPEGDYAIPPIPARGNPSEIDRICLAAANAAKTLSDTYEAMIDAYNEDIDPNFGLAQLAGTASAALAVALGFISFGIGTVIFGVFQLFYEAFQWLTTDSWDAAFTDQVVCYLVECASDDAGVVTFDYDCFMQKVSADSNVTEDLTDIRRFAQIWYMMQFIGIEGLNLAGATTAITTPDCACDCFTYDDHMTSSQGAKDHVVPYAGITNAWGGAAAAGGWISVGGRTGGGCWNSANIGSFSGQARRESCLVIDLGAEYLIDAISFYHKEASNASANSRGVNYYNGAGALIYSNSSTAGGTSTSWRQYTNGTDVANVRYIRVYDDVLNSANTDCYIDDIVVEYC